ncbi:DgyrCDS144 [Dimorphilus gyrociliatus]|uniref:GDP-Man:Man(3)GlcNAc(2)-PP-Dol alpha-1,2-mannosyltransferase n=1 Tax=Dimorphilus gyrociliatus TaxID=2664684 RepID=A0A7I8V505_9ANNE|nr:DgyrCDS144 [Dimorphilus gyrociliatus]
MVLSTILSFILPCITFGWLYYLYKHYVMLPIEFHSDARLDGKTVVITGGSSGLGLETARNLCSRGARVIIGCRDKKKAEEALIDVKSSCKSALVSYFHLDLASLSSVRKFVQELKDSNIRVNILINNAAVVGVPYQKTIDGFEYIFGVNYLGHFLLTNLMLDLLEARARIINVSAHAHIFGHIDFDNLMMDRGFNSIVAYFNSKLAMVLFTQEISRRLDIEVACSYALHPGAIYTQLTRHFFFMRYKFLRMISDQLGKHFLKNAKQGIHTILYCALSEEIEGVSGKYFSDCKLSVPIQEALDIEIAERLWSTSEERRNSNRKRIAFFHPYCNAGGGGERVLWMAVNSIQQTYPKADITIYSGDLDATSESIIEKCKENFSITLKRPVSFVWLKSRFLVEAKCWPIFTLAGQSFGSMLLCLEALWKFTPDVYIDSMGYAFTLPIAKIIGSKVGCYVHYPTISTDMLDKVSSRKAAHNNSQLVAKSSILSSVKHSYYRLFAFLYGLAGKTSECVMVNSSWTKNHIDSLWNIDSIKVFPPVDLKRLLNMKIDNERSIVLSVAQFRPEKDHELQIKAFAKYLSFGTDTETSMMLVGSVRNQKDEERVEKLKSLANLLGVRERVEFKINASYEDLLTYFKNAAIGLHTMWNEHFGIGVVECMAAGAIALAHKSGGPKMDIVTPLNGETTGFLADTIDEYAEYISNIIRMSPENLLKIRQNARKSVERFSNENFQKDWIKATEILFV